MSVVYNGIDIARFEQAEPTSQVAEASNGGKVVIFCPARMLSMTTGALNTQKNISLILDTLVVLKTKGVTNFHFIGITNKPLTDATATDVIAEAIQTRGLQNDILLLPVINPDEMPGLYAGVDIVAVPAVNETFGLMYVEAMAAGKVVIASDSGGPKEYIRNGENGYFVGTEDPSELADLLQKLILDLELRQKIGKEAKKTARQFTIAKMVDSIESIYENSFQTNPGRTSFSSKR